MVSALHGQTLTYQISKIKVALESYKAYRDGYRIIANQGGTRSGKTYTLTQLLIALALKEKLHISICSVAFPHLRRGVMRDWMTLMDNSGLYDVNQHTRTEQVYTYPNGSIIEFFSVDNALKVRGPGRDILFINECNLIQKDTFRQLLLRTRKTVFLDYNPADEFHWIYDEVLTRKDCKFIKSTYLDNPFLPKEQVKEIENLKNIDENAWRIYGEGERGHSEGIIYTNWNTYSNSINGNVCYGLDFGYNNPTALVRITENDKNLYCQEVLYQSFLTNADLISFLKQNVKIHEPIFADAAEPQRIEEIRKAGFNIRPANKAVKDGIDFVKSRKLFIHSSSANLLKEIKSYKYQTTREGKQISEEPLKLNDHACFIGETLITTIDGFKRIDEIKVGDLVLTSKGFKKVLNTFNNGKKKVSKYWMQTDTILVSLSCTDNHLIKTGNTWAEISTLESGLIISHINILMAENTFYNQVKGILKAIKDICIKTFGHFTTVKEKQDTTYTIKTGIHGITELRTLKQFYQTFTYHSTLKSDLKIILNGLKYFILEVLKQLKNGISQKKANCGTLNRQLNLIKKGRLLKEIANNAVKYIRQSTKEYQNIAIQTAKLRHFGEGEKWMETVYDLEVEECHEYFANGILVHNCDALRYGAMGLKKQVTGPSISFHR